MSEKETPVVEYRFIKEFSPEALLDAARLYRIAGWSGEWEAAEFLGKMFKGSFIVHSAWCGNRAIGFARALSDGISDAYIQDVVVDPEFRKQGIGGELVRGLAAELQRRGIVWIGLVGVPGTESFYRGLKFSPQPGYTLWLMEENIGGTI